MVTNRGKTDKRVSQDIARLEGTAIPEYSPKKAEHIAANLK